MRCSAVAAIDSIPLVVLHVLFNSSFRRSELLCLQYEVCGNLGVRLSSRNYRSLSRIHISVLMGKPKNPQMEETSC